MKQTGEGQLRTGTVWDERLLRPAERGKWIERRKLTIADFAGKTEYAYKLAVAINWDGSPENADEGLHNAHQSLVEGLQQNDLCLHVLSYLTDDEWDLVFYTQKPKEADTIIYQIEQNLSDVTLIPEVTVDKGWSYYYSRLNAVPG